MVAYAVVGPTKTNPSAFNACASARDCGNHRGATRAASLARLILLVGLTVVAFGTSAPELAIGLQSSLAGKAGIGVGNRTGQCRTDQGQDRSMLGSRIQTADDAVTQR